MRRTYKGKFTPKNPHKYVGDSSNIIYRSKWEYDFLKIMDTAENIVSYASEEIKIPYINPLDNKLHHYYPDVIIKTSDNKIKIIEIKPFAETQTPKQKRNKKQYQYDCETYITNQAKWSAAIKYCQEKNWEFKVLTENELYGKNKICL